MRILILSANTGEGHNSTAKALMEVFAQQGVDCQMEDTLAYLNKGISKLIAGGHVTIYRYCSKLFDITYRRMEKDMDPEEYSPIYEFLSLGTAKLYKAILQGDFDAILCVHSFSAMMMTKIRRRWGLKIPTYLLTTDYTCWPTSEQCDVDYYFLPSKAQAAAFIRAGHSRLQLIPTGIPVRQAFYHKEDQSLVRQRLGLPQAGNIVLLMCGSMGCGPIEGVARALAEKLPKDAMVVAVCGSNQKLYHAMSQIQNPRLRVLGYTKNIPEYMDAADLIVTKPGGLSSTEAANKALPMVFLNTIGACETRNFDYFLSRGYALGSSKPEEVVALAVQLAADPRKRQQMSELLQKDFCINSAQVIVDRMCKDGAAYRESQMAAAVR